MINSELKQILEQIVKTGRGTNMPTLGALAKAQSELGEFAEAILIEEKLVDKPLPESAFGEAADTIICILDTLGKRYPEISPEWVIQNLETYLVRKHNKWTGILGRKNEA